MSRTFRFTPRIMDMSLPIETQLDVRESQREDLLATRADIDHELKCVEEEIAELRRKLAAAADATKALSPARTRVPHVRHSSCVEPSF